jgi:hypothetical protein
MTGDPGTTPPTSEERLAAATRYVRENRDRFTPEALTSELTSSGYTPAEIAEAMRASEAGSAAGAAEGKDRRNLVAAIIAGAYIVTWLVFTIGWLIDQPVGTAALLAGIFAVALLIPGVIALVLVRSWDRLRQASLGTVVAALVVPVVILVGIAGLCVATFSPFPGVA